MTFNLHHAYADLRLRPSLNRCPHLCHVAARHRERFMAVIDEQLGGAGMRDDLLYLTEVDQEGAMAAYDDGFLVAFVHTSHKGTK